MTTTTAQVFGPLARYATVLHDVAGGTHHVASPLGAWLLLALCGPAATAERRDELAAVLGVDVDTAASVAAELLGQRHPLVLAAAGLWQKQPADTDAMTDWLGGLPSTVETGTLPSQVQLNTWADEHTLGLIDKFPVTVTPDTLLILATALATKVSWDHPFDVVPAELLGGGSAFVGRVENVLRTPSGRGHEQYIVGTERIGDVAVHSAMAQGGLKVTSVVAAPDVSPNEVLAVAYEIAHASATGGPVARRSLFDLPVGERTLWTLTEETAPTAAANGREEVCTAILPAWSARSELDLARPELGFPAAAAALAELLGMAEFRYEAKQSAVARYSAVGFEAAAVSAMAIAVGFAMPREGLVRHAELRFGHPYAVVAVAMDPQGGPWHGIPVFSAWVSDVEEADQPAVDEAG